MVELPSRQIDWTGERCVPWGDEVQGIYEHLHRHHFAAEFAAGKRVLDLASGEGYGSAILARRAAAVVGLELDAASVAHSRAAYVLPNLEFVEGSMLELSLFGSGSFDLVVCFEAIEHVHEQAELVAGIARVLDLRGIAVLSTPDRDTYNASVQGPNPFHVRELSYAEFVALLRSGFDQVAVWGQTGVGGSRLASLEGTSDGETHEMLVRRHGGEWLEERRAAPMYLVAIASRARLPGGRTGPFSSIRRATRSMIAIAE